MMFRTEGGKETQGREKEGWKMESAERRKEGR